MLKAIDCEGIGSRLLTAVSGLSVADTFGWVQCLVSAADGVTVVSVLSRCSLSAWM